MKQYIWIFIILGSLVAGCAGSTRVIAKPDVPPLVGKTVAVLDFEEQVDHVICYCSPRTSKAGQIVADQISDALSGYTEMRIVERSRIRKILEEQKVSLSDLFKESEYKKIAGLLGADYLIFGTVNEHCAIGITGIVRGFAGFSVKCVSVETGKHVWSSTVSSSSFYTSPTTISAKLAKKVVSKLMKEFRKTRDKVKINDKRKN